MSLHITQTVALCMEKGFEVPAGMANKCENFCRNVRNYLKPYYSEKTKASLSAFALYALTRLKKVRFGVVLQALMLVQDVSKEAEALLNKYGLEGFPMEALGWLLEAFFPESPEDAPVVTRLLGQSLLLDL